MQPINAPMQLGQNGPEVVNLQEILMHFISSNLIAISDDNLVNGLAEEYTQEMFGSATAAIVRLYQNQESLSETSIPVLDALTVSSINDTLTQLNATGKILNGNIRSTSGAIPNELFTVKLYKATLQGKSLVGTTSSDIDGGYKFFFDAGSTDAGKKVGYEVVATDSAATNHSSGINYLYGHVLNLDLTIADPEVTLSEYEEIHTAMVSVLGNISIAGISEADHAKIAFLAAETGERIAFIAYIIRAARIAATLTNVSEAAIYGLLRQNVNVSDTALASITTDILKRALTIAIETNLIPAMSDEQLDAVIVALRVASVHKVLALQNGITTDGAFFSIIQDITEDEQWTAFFIDTYMANGFVADDAFWQKIATQEDLEELIPDLKLAITFAILTGNNPAIVLKLRDDTYEPADLVSSKWEDWQQIIQTAKTSNPDLFFFPQYLQGENDNEKVEAYARQLYGQAEFMFPTEAIAYNVAIDESGAFPALNKDFQNFLELNEGFKLESVLPHEITTEMGYSFNGIPDRDLFVSEIAKVQRLMYLSNSYSLISAIAGKGFGSSLQIAMCPETDFITALGEDVPSEAPSQIYSTARSVSAYSTAALFSFYASAFQSANGGASAPSASATNVGATPSGISWINGIYFDPMQTYAEWRTLFGQLDGCNCCHCQSVYSPSAYLTDMLHFLKVNVTASTVHDTLLSYRRPDIKDIELTCKNANTPVPQIDLINEMLEDLISSNAAGHFSSNGNYMIYARQTVADAATQRAVPEYVNTNGAVVKSWDSTSSSYVPISLPTPYPSLSAAEYPWSLPYNFYKRQIDTHLDLTSVKGYELIQRFGSDNKLQAWDDYGFCIAYLRIFKKEADIITTAPPATLAGLAVAYGFKYNSVGGTVGNIPDPARRGGTLTVSAGTWITGTLGQRVDVFLQQTGLNYSDLLQLLDCYTINPFISLGVRKLAILKNSANVPDDTCHLDELKIQGLDEDVLTMLHRFVRMKRALGWTYYELDRAMLALGISTTTASTPANISQSEFKALVRLKHLSASLNLSVEDTAIFFADIDELEYRDYTKSEPKDIPNKYLRIFRNSALVDVNAASYPFDINPGTAVGQPFDVVANHLSGILNISVNDLQKIFKEKGISRPTVTPTLSRLSEVYREVLFIKGLGISTSDWFILKAWIGDVSSFGNAGDSTYNTHVDFDNLDTESLIRLFTFIRELSDVGISAVDIDYLLQDKMQDAVADDALNNYLESSLATLRAALQGLWSPGYDAVTDTDGTVLLGLLKTVMDEDKATRLVSIVQLIATADPDYNASAATSLINTDLAFLDLIGTTALSLLNTTLTTTGSNPNNPLTRRAFVFEHLDDYMKQTLLQPYIISYFANEYKLSEELIGILLRDCVTLNAGTMGSPTIVSGLSALTNAAFIADSTVISRWYGGTSAPAYILPLQATLLLQKAVRLTQVFQMREEDVTYMWVKSMVFKDILRLSDLPLRTTQVVSSLSPLTLAPFSKLLNTLRWVKVRSFMADKTPAFYRQIERYATNISNVSKTDFTTVLAAVFKMDQTDLDTLLGNNSSNGAFQVNYANGTLLAPVPNTEYRLPLLYLRIIDALEIQYLLPSTLTALTQMSSSIQLAADQSDANAVTQVVKGQYADKEWIGVVRPLSDKLRTERRDAMVAYLLAHPPVGYENIWRSSNDIFDTLMIDVDMMACMSTTRVLLAINSIQLWVDRVLLGLEKDVVASTSTNTVMLKIDKDSARQWQTWRKRYRIWEANRKIFIYPENWIEPELRDDKTPLFTELEKFLKQNEVTKENVEAAYCNYLERLDEIAHLDIIGMYRETKQTDYTQFDYSATPTERDTIHVFGRTPVHPHVFYYRKRVADEWTHWEKMDVQLDGDHFIPTMWRGRLRFYWLVFTKDLIADAGAKTRSKEDFVTPASTRWKINLAWTEYKNGKWTAKQVSKQALYSFAIEEEDVTSLEHLAYMKDRENKGLEVRAWYPSGSLDRQVKERFYFFNSFDADGNLVFEVSEKILRTSTPRLSSYFKRKTLVIKGSPFPIGTITPPPPVLSPQQPTPYITDDKLIPENLRTIDSDEIWNDMFPATTGRFVVQFNSISTITDGNLGAPNLYMPITHNSSWSWIIDQSSIEYKGYRNAATDFHYETQTPALGNMGAGYAGYVHEPDFGLKLLDYAPDIQDGKPSGKYLVFPRQLPEGYIAGSHLDIPYFFYKDYDNTFFVEKILERSPSATAPFGGRVINKTVAISSGSFTSIKLIPYLIKYRFHNFRHDRVNDFRKQLFESGLDGLLDRNYIYNLSDTLNFANDYAPTINVLQRYFYDIPRNSVVFERDNAYAAYNWELFYHIPVLIANKLSQNRQFEEARRWYHYVFNPTIKNTGYVADFWNFQPFYKEVVTGIPSITSIMQSAGLNSAVAAWANDPFKPHLVARTRISAYMKNTVMKYLDNLIAWGDDLFRSDTREDMVESTLMYVLAAQLLGRKPVDIPARATPEVQTYAMMEYGSATSSLNAFGNALVKVESIMYASGVTLGTFNPPTGTTTPMYYFCIPPNDKLYDYWNTIADRLFKIRNCRNIDGVERDLALYDPPIDPALLVKAAAAGISASDAIAAANAPLPNYRFGIMAQKATELAGEVKALGGQLLSALEKKDAEHLALLRGAQEQKVFDAVTAVKEGAIEEAVTQINGLQQQQIMTTQRRDHYKRLIDDGLNGEEQLQLDSMSESIPLHIAQGTAQTLSTVLGMVPNFTVGPFSAGATYGGANLGLVANATAEILGIRTNLNSITGSMAATKGSFARRAQDWELQLKLASTELKQIDKQIIAAQIRQAMAEKELDNHKLQIRNAQEMDEAMRGKYTNEDLYDWMTGQISMSYFSAYKLAYDVAKKAERCYQNDLNLPLASFIGYEYWDSLHKGLLAGEQLAYDIKRMEVSYLEKNKRSLELTKHISLAALNPGELMKLKTIKHCTVDIPEWLYDLDYPGQHMRRIKSVSMSIPCVAGPYTTVSCKLSLLKSRYRKNSTAATFAEVSGSDPNFQYLYGPIQSIATSHAQSDSGMFDFSFRDERYLPFEGAGAVSQWKIELPAVYAQFDYNSISDVILHINYTALDEGSLRTDAEAYVKSLVDGSLGEAGLYRIFDLRHEFPNEWQQLLNGSSQTMILQHLKDRLPYMVQGKTIDVTDIALLVENPQNSFAPKLRIGAASYVAFPAPVSLGSDWYQYSLTTGTYDITSNWYFKADRTVNSATVPATAADVDNMLLLIAYKATP